MAKTKVVSLSLTKDEEQELINISKEILGNSNKSGLVRYWINNHNKNKVEEMRQ